jgi:hypothetical protein
MGNTKVGLNFGNIHVLAETTPSLADIEDVSTHTLSYQQAQNEHIPWFLPVLSLGDF